MRPRGGASPCRYRTSEENYKLFTSRKPMYLEYEGTSFIEWEFPDVRTAEDKSSPTRNCPFAGTYRVKPQVKTETFEDKEQYLPASDRSSCFMWYVTAASQTDRTDPLSISESQSSQILGRLFWNLGQEPVVHIYLKKEKYYSQEHPKLGGFFFGEFTSGVMAVELQPSIFENACKLQHQVSYVGCPPGRHIVVERPVDVVCEKHHFTNYKIPGLLSEIPAKALSVPDLNRKFLWNPTDEDQIAYFDWDKYGCPMELHYEEYFQPVISLKYSADKLRGMRKTSSTKIRSDSYVRNVEANFILWETKGRTDYGYTSFIKEAGCLYKAQSWPMMLKRSKNSTLDKIWGPQNYRSCFVFHQNSTNEGLHEQYQILKSTSNNYIVWVLVIVPFMCSDFCDLKVFFAVRIYSVIERSDTPRIMLYSVITVFIFLVVLIISYKYTTTNI